MTKAISHRKLKRPVSHRISLLRNLATSLILNEKLKTTYPKAKELSRFIEKMVTTAKNKNLSSMRKISRDIKDKQALKKLFDIIAPKYQNKTGGYTQVLRLYTRKGDGAEISLIKFS